MLHLHKHAACADHTPVTIPGRSGALKVASVIPACFGAALGVSLGENPVDVGTFQKDVFMHG